AASVRRLRGDSTSTLRANGKPRPRPAQTGLSLGTADSLARPERVSVDLAEPEPSVRGGAPGRRHQPGEKEVAAAEAAVNDPPIPCRPRPWRPGGAQCRRPAADATPRADRCPSRPAPR